MPARFHRTKTRSRRLRRKRQEWESCARRSSDSVENPALLPAGASFDNCHDRRKRPRLRCAATTGARKRPCTVPLTPSAGRNSAGREVVGGSPTRFRAAVYRERTRDQYQAAGSTKPSQRTRAEREVGVRGQGPRSGNAIRAMMQRALTMLPPQLYRYAALSGSPCATASPCAGVRPDRRARAGAGGA